ncbi:MAG TPA: CRTAC1 family protein [Dehalococcoidia bacterium]|nr:CRTAC1 family protein [Dehalococcoidia bacterium]
MTLFRGAALLGLLIGLFIATGRELGLKDASSANPGTVTQCIQGRCIEIALDDGNDSGVLTAREEIERLGRIPPSFREVASQAGVAFQHTRDDNFFNLGGGAAAGDFNNDGWIDLYVTNSAGPNALYRNNADGSFTDIAVSAGVADLAGRGHGVAWGDFNNDGFLDLYVANYGNSRLFRNNGDETFRDVTTAAGVADPGPDYRTTGAVWGDYDRDGLLDLLIVRHVDAVGPLFTLTDTAAIVLLRQCRTEEFYANPKVPRGVVIGDSHDFSQRAKRNFDGGVRSLKLYHNRGNGTFEDVTSMLDDGKGYPSNIEGAGFKPAFVDYDNDGDLDIYVVNDYGDEIYPNVLWRNDGPTATGAWSFSDVSEGSGANPPMFGMGLAAGDYDNDSDLDFYVTDIGSSRFFENRAGLFEDVTDRTDTGRGVIPENGDVNLSIGWGATFADLDNDGWLDLYMTNGQIDSDPCSNLPHQPNAVFINQRDGSFADVSQASRANDPGTSREVVDADFNNDGRVDLFVVNIGSMDGTPGISRLFLNQDESRNHWLQIQPVSGPGALFSVGARVEVTVDGITMVQYAGQAQGHMSQSMIPVHFGTGAARRVDRVEVRWPSGAVQTLREVDADQRLVVEEPR